MSSFFVKSPSGLIYFPFKIASVYHSRIHLEIHLEILSVAGKYDKCSSGTKAIEYKKNQGNAYRIYFE